METMTATTDIQEATVGCRDRHQATDADVGIWPVIKGLREGWLTPPAKPGEGLPEAALTFTCDLSVEEVMEEIRGR